MTASFVDSFIPASLRENPEASRRAKLIVGFGWLGGVFGAVYALFYFAIGHAWGAGIVVASTAAVVAVPFILRATASTLIAGNIYAFILTAGFAGLTAIEGSVRGHAVAWIATVPLCALLLAGARSGLGWFVVCFGATAIFGALDFFGIETTILYPMSWHSALTTAGFLGLSAFLILLGFIFEKGRADAFARMEAALAELSAANDRLQRLNAEKNEFLGIAAHDLKNPLGSIMLGAQLITERGMLDVGETRVEAEAILRASRSMLEIITNLLDINAIEEGRFPVTLEPCDLGALTGEVVAGYWPRAERKQIVLRHEAVSLLATADRRATLQVLDNIVSNAVKYSPPGLSVHIRVVEREGAALVEVEDEGPGLSVEDQAKLFGKFQRLTARPTGNESSNGLGLSIVKRMTEAMGGTVTCRSTLGSGATFIVSLPRG